MAGVEQLIGQYRTEYRVYARLAAEVAHVLESALQGSGVRIHNIDHRGKALDSLSEKLRRPGKSYTNLTSIPDLAGVRIVVYEISQVNVVQELCSELFDFAETAPNLLAPEVVNQFGYVSRHLIIRAGEARAALPEWKIFGDRRAEVQIRTVLQHAWADVSHEYEYKQEREVPLELRRRLSRVAALLELADSEFSAIAADHIERRRQLQTASGPDRLDARLDRDSVEVWLASEKVRIGRIVDIAGAAGFGLEVLDFGVSEGDGQSSFSYLLAMAEHLGLNRVSDIEPVLNTDTQVLQAYFGRLMKRSGGTWHVDTDFVLSLVLLLLHEGRINVVDLVNDDWNEELADRVIRQAVETMAAIETGSERP